MPEDVIVTDEEDELDEVYENDPSEGIEIKSDNSSDLGIENTPPVVNPLATVDA